MKSKAEMAGDLMQLIRNGTLVKDVDASEQGHEQTMPRKNNKRKQPEQVRQYAFKIPGQIFTSVLRIVWGRSLGRGQLLPQALFLHLARVRRRRLYSHSHQQHLVHGNA